MRAMRTRPRLAHALAAGACALALVAAGCGGDDEDEGGSGGATAPAAETKPAGEEGGATASVDGAEVFKANCASCHTLAAADASGSFGTNLDELKPDAATVSAQVKAGGGGMPAFEGQLDDAEIQAVSDYVADNAGK